ncbi:MAG: hypothetical protein ABL958_13530 [Bdellovibrionia bacterium]
MKKQRSVYLELILFLLTMIAISFTNCSSADFAAMSPENTKIENPDSGEDGYDGGLDDPNDPGLDGGHFDLDTSSSIYPLGNGRTDHHVHEYDDRHNVASVDFFNLLDGGFTEISSKVSAGQEFIIIVANAQLSTGTYLEINGSTTRSTVYQTRVDDYRAGAPLTKYTLATLTSFKLKFDANAITGGGLIPTQTSCVVGNDAGAKGEYRNGALTIQILDAATAQLSPTTKTATAGLLWEATVFWHKQGAGCY